LGREEGKKERKEREKGEIKLLCDILLVAV
jgi:hypothetical protein